MIPRSRQKALFLDRDGIINVDHGYVSAIDDFEFSSGIFELLESFRDAGYLFFVVTNQSGIGRGYYSEADFQKLTRWMTETFQKRGITIEEVFYCRHTPDDHCRCRKPDIGMIEEALLKYPLDLEHSWMIGDKASDMVLADNAGIPNSIYIGKERSAQATLSFVSVDACARYFQENQGKISTIREGYKNKTS
ncbi:MAG TPA: D-glycero-beta-D-manno-heptose 1,7-bisphosphate 7-phosphatase [Epsilonproteobacteria bacterium]|nr:D-glycero-beta-D-manno-heptose 1,7-bisphosphate 7-phosphatase [Campylobacterota bacterium]